MYLIYFIMYIVLLSHIQTNDLSNIDTKMVMSMIQLDVYTIIFYIYFSMKKTNFTLVSVSVFFHCIVAYAIVRHNVFNIYESTPKI